MLPMSTPDESKRRRPASAPLQLALLRLGVSPRGALAYVLLLLLLVLALLARCTLLCTAAGTSREAPCAAVAPRPGIAAHGALAADGGSGARAALAAASSPSVALPLPPPPGETMADVVVGVMTCRRFHRTRCRAQGDTWLRRARRVVWFSDSDPPSDATSLGAPLVAHQFAASRTERVFSGGNWRAVPILRALAQTFFSAEAQRAMRERGEHAPGWVYMCDDDTFAFTRELLLELRKRDPDKPHYLGYAFIAAPHLEGIVPGKRQPLFANGGAGIAVSRGALVAALPHFARCEAEYKWNWPGDVRVAQCLLDAGVKLEWLRNFHAEAPDVIIHEEQPPPGSVPVGLHLPPVSFHHIDTDALNNLQRMSTVAASVGGLPHVFDLGGHAFQPLVAESAALGLTLALRFGYEVLVMPAAASGRAARFGGRDVGRRTTAGDYLASFDAVPISGARAPRGARQPEFAFVQTLTGGECKQNGELRGGYEATVTTRCGGCDAAAARVTSKAGPTGLRVCSFAFEGCKATVDVALDPARCPSAEPLFRVGLDAGTAPMAADVVRDGAAAPSWAAGCLTAGGGSLDDATHTKPCSRFSVGAAGRAGGERAAALSLWFRVLSGSANVRLRGLTARRARDVAGGGGVQLAVSLEQVSHGVLLLNGGVAAAEAGQPAAAGLSPRYEPPGEELRIAHRCEGADADGEAGGVLFRVEATLDVPEHLPLQLAWIAVCH